MKLSDIKKLVVQEQPKPKRYELLLEERENQNRGITLHSDSMEDYDDAKYTLMRVIERDADGHKRIVYDFWRPDFY